MFVYTPANYSYLAVYKAHQGRIQEVNGGVYLTNIDNR